MKQQMSGQSSQQRRKRKAEGGFSLGIVQKLKLKWSAKKHTYHLYHFDLETVKTVFFEPSAHYVYISMSQPGVLQHLLKNESIFMIIDIRIAEGVRISHRQNSGKGAEGSAKLELPISGIESDIGFDAGANYKTHSTTDSFVSHAFVFAYRLMECRYDNKSAVPRTSLFTKNANIHGLETPGMDTGRDSSQEDSGDIVRPRQRTEWPTTGTLAPEDLEISLR